MSARRSIFATEDEPAARGPDVCGCSTDLRITGSIEWLQRDTCRDQGLMKLRTHRAGLEIRQPFPLPTDDRGPQPVIADHFMSHFGHDLRLFAMQQHA